MPRPGRLAVLTYHSIDDSGSVLSTPPRVFAEQMRFLHERGMRVVPLAKALDNLRAAPSDDSVAITFDDGFENVYTHALPVLCRYGFPATVFLVTDYCGRLNAWPGQPDGIARQRLLTWPQVREMSALGVTFGSHTRTHPDLVTLAPEMAGAEMADAKRVIEDEGGGDVESVAYPYGRYSSAIVRLAAAHFRLGCSTRLGFAQPAGNPLALDRLDMYYWRDVAFFARLFSPAMSAYIHVRRSLRRVREVAHHSAASRARVSIVLQE